MAGQKGGNDWGRVYVIVFQDKRLESPSWKLYMR